MGDERVCSNCQRPYPNWFGTSYPNSVHLCGNCDEEFQRGLQEWIEFVENSEHAA